MAGRLKDETTDRTALIQKALQNPDVAKAISLLIDHMAGVLKENLCVEPETSLSLRIADFEHRTKFTIAELGLSTRASICLESKGINTAGDLIQQTEAGLLAIRNFGESTLREAKSKLADHGLHLGMKAPTE